MSKEGDHRMIEHVKREEMETFCALDLPGREAISIAKHLHSCRDCHRLFEKVSRSQRYRQPLVFNFSLEYTLKNAHLEYSDLVAFSEGQMQEEESEQVEEHCQMCEGCRNDVRAFQAYLDEFNRYREVRLGPLTLTERLRLTWNDISSSTWVRKQKMKPLTFSLAALSIILGVAVVLSFMHGNKSLQPALNSTPLSSIPENKAGDISVPAQPAVEEKGLVSNNSADERHTQTDGSGASSRILIAVSDNGRLYGINEQGTILGVEGYPVDLKNDITKLMKGNIIKSEPPPNVTSPIVKSRGLEIHSGLKLLTPVATYVSGDQPVLKWQLLPGDYRYVVSIVNENFNEVEKSPELITSNYKITRKLERGAVYQWQVKAFKDGRENLVTQREVGKFMVITADKFRHVTEARKRYRSHLVLGVIYKKDHLLAEAEEEFRQLVQANPKSGIAHKLLDSVTSR